MDRGTKNAEIFADTANLCRKIERLRDCIKESNNNQTLYLEKDVSDIKTQRGDAADVIVSGKRSFEAAAPYARAGKKSTKKKKDITFFVVIQREDEEEYNQEYKNKRPSVDALEIKGGKS